MKVVLISPYSDITSFGIRSLSASLRQAGIGTRLIFLPHTPSEWASTDDIYPTTILDHVAELCKDAELIGISLMTSYFVRVAALTQRLKQTTAAQVIWGGIHPTIRPMECLDFADAICVGEGEEAMLEYARAVEAGRIGEPIPNIGYRINNKIKLNPPRPLIQHLDSLPHPDYSLDDHWVWDFPAADLQLFNPTLFYRWLMAGHISRIRNEAAYQTIATRGCPHNCAYCCNSTLRQLYKGQPYLRRRGIENILDELERITKHYDFIRVIGFSDDSFFAAREEEIQDFSTRYKERIGLPFFCLGSPLTMTETKLNHLVEAGLFGLQMGIQTGSRRTLKRYQRPIPIEKVLESARVINKFRDKLLPPTYDFIIDNPLETRDDILETVDLMLTLPKPNRLQLFSLVVFPETALFHQLREAGLPVPESPPDYSHDYHQRQATYLNIILGLIRHGFSPRLIRLLTRKKIVSLLDHPIFSKFYKWLYAIARMLNRKILKRR